MTSGPIPLCMACEHREGHACKAFPEAIPDVIWIEGGDHRTSVVGDGGVVFELDPAKKDRFESWLARQPK